MTRSRLIAVLLAALLLVAATQFFFYYRDNFSTHYPIKVISAHAFRGGTIPFWNFNAGAGQPLAGNPNTLTFYPDNILYLLVSPGVAFNLHFLLHLVCAFFAMRALLERRGSFRTNATIGAAIFIMSGVAVTATAFYNLTTAVALIPLALLMLEMCLDRPSFRSSLLFGASLGLLGLSGEPVTIIGAAIVLAGFAIGRTRSAALAWMAVSAALAIVIASPLLIAYSEIAGEVTRAFQPYSARTTLAASLVPDRLLEIIVGPLYGVLTELGPAGFQPPAAWGPWPPLFGSIFIGAIVLPALFATRGAMRERVVAALLVFLALGRFNPIVAWVIGHAAPLRIIRYPEKFTIPLTVVLVLLIARWLEERADAKRDRIVAAVAIAILVGSCAFVIPSAPPVTIARIVAGLLIAIAVLVAAMWRDSRRAREAMLILTFTPLAFWAARSVALDQSKHYESASSAARVIGNARVFSMPDTSPLKLASPSERDRYRIAAAMIDPLFGASFGVRYTLDRSPDGMYSWLSRIVLERATTAELDRALRYAQLTGCSFVATRRVLDDPRLTLAATDSHAGNPFYVYRLSGAMPRVFAPSRVFASGSVQEAVRRIESPNFDASEVTVPQRKVAAAAPATIESLHEEAGALRFRVHATRGTTIVVNESYFSAWRATAAGKELSTFPANIDRLGIAVPAGECEVVVRFGRRRELVGLALFASLSLLLAAVIAATAAKTEAPR